MSAEMCTYATQRASISGSGKSPLGWIPLSTATVYVDHPVHAQALHTVNIDLAAPDRGPAARVAMELPVASALQLVQVIAQAVLSAPADVSGLEADQLARLSALLD